MIRRWLVAALVASACLVSGCSLDPARLPVPGAYVPIGKYSIKIEFSSVLNLPARAKVDLGGVQVGVLDRVQLVGSTAVAYVDVNDSVKLPQNTRAELRQATVLGDIYIALLPAENPAPSHLHDGDTIPLRNTVPADNVEDILRSVSTLVSGGSLSTLEESVANFNNAFSKDPAELDRMRQKLAGMLRDLAANQDRIDEILTSTERVSNGLLAETGAFDRLINEGPVRLRAMSAVLPSIVQLLVCAQDLGRYGGELFVPNTPDLLQMLSYITPTVKTIASADTTLPAMADKMIALIRDKLIPFYSNGGPRLSVSVNPATRADEAIAAMRTMGMLP
ncbi:MlaD family protein [Mycobacterium paragordonae]|uniref:MlaD family protein n=1 Tax=Mycobacterium paragordonae TaxID=1389713 RepID=A0A4R5WL30_9MYCO|nr:MlaD family protein [Mycobacterium paragordonae]MDP7738425.1 MlaD family protein [Mycobacterium paragordonae]TDK90932.1 MCE family protein [Mycobacterium paragordonae]TDL03679.1 MCE family protein [Mycobacterium paragordonae]